jgi:hypothetical protein
VLEKTIHPTYISVSVRECVTGNGTDRKCVPLVMYYMYNFTNEIYEGAKYLAKPAGRERTSKRRLRFEGAKILSKSHR